MSQSRPKSRTAWNTYQLHHGPNMTPMVDVVMVILIFFMATASVLGPEWYLKSSLPHTAPASATTTPDQDKLEQIRLKVIVRNGTTVITAEGLPETSVTGAAAFLMKRREAGDPKKMVVLITPDAAVPYQDLVALHEACEKLGIVKVGVQAE